MKILPILSLTHFPPAGWGYTVVGTPCLRHKVEETLQKPPSSLFLLRGVCNFFSSTPHHHHSFSWDVCKIFSFSGRPLPPIMYTDACHGSHIIILFCESLNPLLAAFWQVCQWSLLSLSFLDPISSSIFELTSGSPNSFYFIFPRTIANIIWQIPKSAAARVLISNASYFHRIWKKEPTHQNWKWSETVHNQPRIVNEQKLCSHLSDGGTNFVL